MDHYHKMINHKCKYSLSINNITYEFHFYTHYFHVKIIDKNEISSNWFQLNEKHKSYTSIENLYFTNEVIDRIYKIVKLVYGSFS